MPTPRFLLQVVVKIRDIGVLRNPKIAGKYLDFTKECLRGGANSFRFSIDPKSSAKLCKNDLRKFMKEIEELCTDGTMPFVNDLETAYGANVGLWIDQSSKFSVTEARELLPDHIIGVTCYSLDGLRNTDGADLAAIVLDPSEMSGSLPKLVPDFNLYGIINQAVQASNIPVIGIANIPALPALVTSGLQGAAFSRRLAESEDPCEEMMDIKELVDLLLANRAFGDISCIPLEDAHSSHIPGDIIHPKEFGY